MKNIKNIITNSICRVLLGTAMLQLLWVMIHFKHAGLMKAFIIAVVLEVFWKLSFTKDKN